MADGQLFDSTVVIDGHNGDARALAYLEPLIRKGAAFTHPVSAAEVLAGALNRRELTSLDRFLGAFRMAGVKQRDFLDALNSLRLLTLAHRIGWPDCLIAATGIRLGLPVVTVNDRHFRLIRGLSVIRPY